MPINYPSMKSSELMGILDSLGYLQIRRSGSHRRLVCQGRTPLTFSFHDGVTIPPGLVKKVLKKDVGLSDKEILAVLNNGKNHKEPNNEEH